MADSLLLAERVKNTLQLGESHFREFKSALFGPSSNKRARPVSDVSRDIAEALVAFANADGGDLLVGVEDDGLITGVPHTDEDVKLLLGATQTHVHRDTALPIITKQSIVLDGKRVLVFTVSKGTTEVCQLADGRCVVRRDRETVPANPARILFDRQEVRSREYDRQFVDGASVADLDQGLVQSAANEFLFGLSIERYLQQVGLADYAPGGLRLRRAALLLFASDIQRWHPASQVRILKVAGVDLQSGDRYNVAFDDFVAGSLFDLVVKAWEKLRPYLASRTEFGADARFEQKYIYPEWACREALVNAIAHRDYTVHAPITIFIFDDRMEMASPGGLLSTLSIRDLEELRGVHESRNALVAKVLRERGLMRELGEGMKRMFQLMEENELEKPRLHSDNTSFSVTLPHRSVFSTKQEEWLLMFQQFGLTSLQKKILALGMDGREISPAEIYKAMNTTDRNTYDREVTALRTKRVMIETRTNPAATSYARRNKVPKGEVPRFRVQIPTLQPVEAEKSRPVAPAPGRRSISSANRTKRTAAVMFETAVYVVGLGPNVTELDLKKTFETVGQVIRAQVPVNSLTRRNRGYGFVWFDSSASAREAVSKLDGFELGGRPISVKPYARQEKVDRV